MVLLSPHFFPLKIEREQRTETHGAEAGTYVTGQMSHCACSLQQAISSSLSGTSRTIHLRVAISKRLNLICRQAISTDTPHVFMGTLSSCLSVRGFPRGRKPFRILGDGKTLACDR